MKTFWVWISYPTVMDTEIDKRYETFRVARNREREREKEGERERDRRWAKCLGLAQNFLLTNTIDNYLHAAGEGFSELFCLLRGGGGGRVSCFAYLWDLGGHPGRSCLLRGGGGGRVRR